MDPTTPGGGADATTATAPTPTAAGTTLTATAPVAPEAAPVAAPSKGDWAGMVTSQRETNKRLDALVAALSSALTPTAPAAQQAAVMAPAPADPGVMAAVEEMRFDLALEKAFGVHRIADDNPLREVITAAAKSLKPKDLREYVGRYARLGGPGTTAAAVSTPITPSNSGAPASSPTGAQLPENPYDWDTSIISKLTPDEFRGAIEKYENKRGRGNPFALMRQRAEAARKR